MGVVYTYVLCIHMHMYRNVILSQRARSLSTESCATFYRRAG